MGEAAPPLVLIRRRVTCIKFAREPRMLPRVRLGVGRFGGRVGGAVRKLVGVLAVFSGRVTM